MSAQHPSRNWKGCALCKPNKIKGDSERKYSTATKRRLGKSRRMNKRTGIEDY